MVVNCKFLSILLLIFIIKFIECENENKQKRVEENNKMDFDDKLLNDIHWLRPTKYSNNSKNWLDKYEFKKITKADKRFNLIRL